MKHISALTTGCLSSQIYKVEFDAYRNRAYNLKVLEIPTTSRVKPVKTYTKYSYAGEGEYLYLQCEGTTTLHYDEAFSPEYYSLSAFDCCLYEDKDGVKYMKFRKESLLPFFDSTEGSSSICFGYEDLCRNKEGKPVEFPEDMFRNTYDYDELKKLCYNYLNEWCGVKDEQKK